MSMQSLEVASEVPLPSVIMPVERFGPYIRIATAELSSDGKPLLKGLQMQNADGEGHSWMFVRRPASRPERVIVNYWPMGCCGRGEGIEADDRQKVPAWLAQKGKSFLSPPCGSAGWVSCRDCCC